MNEHYRPPPGTPIEDLDTPCLIIDMDDLDNNIDVIASTYAGTTAKLRGHAKNTTRPRQSPTGRYAGAGPWAGSVPPRCPRPRS